MTTILKLESEIRKYINNPRKQYALIANPAAWNKLTSSLDVIGDTELAIDAFFNNEWPNDDGGKYLMIYGVLQGVFIQQDAIMHLAESLGISYSVNLMLKDIREIRNDSIGHPTKREKNRIEIGYNFISRATMSRQGFMLMKTFPSGREPQFININLPDLITEQRELLAELLSDVVDILRKEEKEHRKMYENQKLIGIFPQTLGYYFEKIF